MRIPALAPLLLLACLVANASAAAEEWSRYDNSRFGFSLAIPSAFAPQGESANSDGQSFALANRPARLSTWGGHLMSDFEGEIARAMEFDASGGWLVTDRNTGPNWATWSARQGGRILLQRVILLCNGDSFAAFRLEYSQADRNSIDPLIEILTPSLRSESC